MSELKTWLDGLGFGKFEDKLRECGVESLDDLRVLKTEDEVMELAGADGINMGVVFRRKFIKAVLDLKGLENTMDDLDSKTEPNNDQSATQDVTSNNSATTANNNASTQKRNSKGMSRKEEKALTELVQTIKSHTTKLKKTKEELAKIQKQNEDSRNEMIATFDKAMGTLLSRRKSLEQMIQMAHDECTKKLTTQIEDLQASAKKLLVCQKDIQTKFRDTQQSPDRETTVVNNVTQYLSEVPKADVGGMDIIYTPGEPELNTFIEQYGTIAVGKKKLKTGTENGSNNAETQNVDQ